MRRFSPVDAMLLGTVLLWALNVTVTKYLFLQGWQPLAYAVIRYFCATALFWIYTYHREHSFRIDRADLWLVLLAGGLIYVNQICFVYGLKLGAATTMALLLATTPIFIGLVTVALRLEHLHRQFWVGAAVTFLGVLLITVGGGGSFSTNGAADLLALSHGADLGLLHDRDRAADAEVLARFGSARSCWRSAGCRSSSRVSRS